MDFIPSKIVRAVLFAVLSVFLYIFEIVFDIELKLVLIFTVLAPERFEKLAFFLNIVKNSALRPKADKPPASAAPKSKFFLFLL